MKVVQTIRGVIPRDQLEVSVAVEEHDNALVVKTIWRLKAEGPDGPHVKLDVQAIMLATPEVQAQFGSFGGEMILAAPAARNGADVTVGLGGQQIGTEQAQLG